MPYMNLHTSKENLISFILTSVSRIGHFRCTRENSGEINPRLISSRRMYDSDCTAKFSHHLLVFVDVAYPNDIMNIKSSYVCTYLLAFSNTHLPYIVLSSTTCNF